MIESLFFPFLGVAYLGHIIITMIFTVASKVCIPTKVEEESSFSTSKATFGVVCFLGGGHSGRSDTGC